MKKLSFLEFLAGKELGNAPGFFLICPTATIGFLADQS